MMERLGFMRVTRCTCGGAVRVERRLPVANPPAVLRFLICKVCGARWADLQTRQTEATDRTKGTVRHGVSRQRRNPARGAPPDP
jgi:hypothetical protein